jgi:hypothetical protein
MDTVRFIATILIALSFTVIGGIILIYVKRTPRHLNPGMMGLFGLFLFFTGASLWMDVVNIPVLSLIFLCIGALAAIIAFLNFPNANKRLMELSEYQDLLDAAKEAREKAEEAEIKAAKLLELVKKHHLDYPE